MINCCFVSGTRAAWALQESKSDAIDFNPQAHKLFDPRELRTSLIECVDIPALRVITR